MQSAQKNINTMDLGEDILCNISHFLCTKSMMNFALICKNNYFLLLNPSSILQ